MTTVFICIDWFHPAYKAGGPVQSIANLVEQYANEQVNFRVFCSDADLDGTVNESVVFNEWSYYNQYTQVWYASKNEQTIKIIKREVKNSGADVLFVIGIYSWYFNLIPLLFCNVPVKIISVRGMLHPGALSQKSFKKKIYLALWKLSGLSRRYSFHATDVQEKGFIQKVFGQQARVMIAGNFPRVFALQAATQKKAGVLQMASIALISPMKNIALVLEALQYCQLQIRYDIYGPVKDSTYWQQCLEKIKLLPDNVSVQYCGDVIPTKIAAVLSEYEVVILPSKSENFGHAIFEALSAGKPVITSHNTPFNDLYTAHAGKNISINHLPEITEAIDFFAAMSASEFAAWNTGAHNYAVQHMDADLLRRQYNQLFLTTAS